jgi:hypothetical protein
MPSFRRTPESSLFKRFWTPAFAGVTGREKAIISGNCYKSGIAPSLSLLAMTRPDEPVSSQIAPMQIGQNFGQTL